METKKEKKVNEIFLLSSIIEPILKSVSSRIKYTCLDVNESYLLFGANTGSLYVFERKRFELVRLISNIELKGPIKYVKFCANDEDVVAVATNVIFVMKLNLHDRNLKERIIMKVTEHKDEITQLIWNNIPNTMKLYSGDKQGQVYITDMDKVIEKKFLKK